ncbi:hypothetical protein [Corynebacterium macginleyi]|nr:hypothetical protein [Corynebacterium macginleyi]
MTNNHEAAERSGDNYVLDDTLAGRITPGGRAGHRYLLPGLD